MKLTKEQCNGTIGSELLSLCAAIVEDDVVSKDEAKQLLHWLASHQKSGIPAIEFLTGTMRRIIKDKRITAGERDELLEAIKQILPEPEDDDEYTLAPIDGPLATNPVVTVAPKQAQLTAGASGPSPEVPAWPESFVVRVIRREREVPDDVWVGGENFLTDYDDSHYDGLRQVTPPSEYYVWTDLFDEPIRIGPHKRDSLGQMWSLLTGGPTELKTFEGIRARQRYEVMLRRDPVQGVISSGPWIHLN